MLTVSLLRGFFKLDLKGLFILAENNMKVKADEFDGKVTYGQKRKELGPTYAGHASQLAPTLAELAKLEKEAQLVFLQKFCTVK